MYWGRSQKKLRETVKAVAEQKGVPVYQFRHKERKDEIANSFRRRRNVRDAIVFIGVAKLAASVQNQNRSDGVNRRLLGRTA